MYTVILNGSPRKNGDTIKLLDMFIPYVKGDFKVINTFFENVSPCNDCRKCHNYDGCIIDDNMTEFYNDILNADNIVLASPLHYSMLSGSLLSFISRFQYFFVARNIKGNKNFNMKKKNGFLVLLGGGATKDFYPVEKVAKLALREVDAELKGTLKYIDTDNFPLSDFENFDIERKLKIKRDIEYFAELFL